MKPRFHILAAMAVLGLTAWGIVRAVWPSLPSYNGQSISVWFQKLPLIKPSPYIPVYGQTGGYVSYNLDRYLSIGRVDQYTYFGRKYGSTNESLQAMAAVQSMGTNGLPFLMKKFRQQDSRLVWWAEHHLWKVGLTRSLLRSHNVEREQALTALLILSPLPPAHVQELKRMRDDSDQRISAAASFAFDYATGKMRVPASFFSEK